jgi:RNA polymerase sigma-70 factor, ECF subfamily
MSRVTPACLLDSARFASLYREHEPLVRRAAFAVVRDHALAEDVTQDVFLQVWSHPDRWDPERGELPAYLRLLAKSRAADALRSLRASHRVVQRAASIGPREHVLETDEPSLAAYRSSVRAAVAKLPGAQREAVALAFWGDLTHSEIAHRCSVPHGTVKGRMRLGLKKLRATMVVAGVISNAEFIEELLVRVG